MSSLSQPSHLPRVSRAGCAGLLLLAALASSGCGSASSGSGSDSTGTGTGTAVKPEKPKPQTAPETAIKAARQFSASLYLAATSDATADGEAACSAMTEAAQRLLLEEKAGSVADCVTGVTFPFGSTLEEPRTYAADLSEVTSDSPPAFRKALGAVPVNSSFDGKTALVFIRGASGAVSLEQVNDVWRVTNPGFLDIDPSTDPSALAGMAFRSCFDDQDVIKQNPASVEDGPNGELSDADSGVDETFTKASSDILQFQTPVAAGTKLDFYTIALTDSPRAAKSVVRKLRKSLADDPDLYDDQESDSQRADDQSNIRSFESTIVAFNRRGSNPDGSPYGGRVLDGPEGRVIAQCARQAQRAADSALPKLARG